MLCGAAVAPHVRDLTLLGADGTQFILVARFCTRCHNRPDRLQRTQAVLTRLAGVEIPIRTGVKAPWRK